MDPSLVVGLSPVPLVAVALFLAVRKWRGLPLPRRTGLLVALAMAITVALIFLYRYLEAPAERELLVSRLRLKVGARQWGYVEKKVVACVNDNYCFAAMRKGFAGRVDFPGLKACLPFDVTHCDLFPLDQGCK